MLDMSIDDDMLEVGQSELIIELDIIDDIELDIIELRMDDMQSPIIELDIMELGIIDEDIIDDEELWPSVGTAAAAIAPAARKAAIVSAWIFIVFSLTAEVRQVEDYLSIAPAAFN